MGYSYTVRQGRFYYITTTQILMTDADIALCVPN